jgi:sugar O-acyltransferase (sialic acid O-acetyltransferase NeuD family)
MTIRNKILEKLLLIGAGGHALSCIDVIEQNKSFQISGLIGLPEQKGKDFLGYTILGSDDELFGLFKSYKYALISLGHIHSAERRINLYQQIKKIGFIFPSAIISPFAYVSPHAKLGEGTIVMHGAVINAGVSIGNNCIINSNALLEHGVNVASHCHISTSVNLNGDVKIGEGSFIGSGASIEQGIFVGQNCIVGMGLSLRKNLSDHQYFKG